MYNDSRLSMRDSDNVYSFLCVSLVAILFIFVDCPHFWEFYVTPIVVVVALGRYILDSLRMDSIKVGDVIYCLPCVYRW